MEPPTQFSATLKAITDLIPQWLSWSKAIAHSQGESLADPPTHGSSKSSLTTAQIHVDYYWDAATIAIAIATATTAAKSTTLPNLSLSPSGN